MFEELEQVVKTSGQQDKCCILSQHLCFHRQACGARVCLGNLFQRFVFCILPFPAVSGLDAPCESLSQHDPNTVCRLKFLSSCNRTKGMKYNDCAPIFTSDAAGADSAYINQVEQSDLFCKDCYTSVALYATQRHWKIRDLIESRIYRKKKNSKICKRRSKEIQVVVSDG